VKAREGPGGQQRVFENRGKAIYPNQKTGVKKKSGALGGGRKKRKSTQEKACKITEDYTCQTEKI